MTKTLTFVLLTFFSMSQCSAQKVQSCASGKRKFLSTVSSIKNPSVGRMEKLSFSSELPDIVMQIGPECKIDKIMINDLSGLLLDKEDIVMAFSSTALGNMGFRATPAIPDLEAALIRAKKLKPGEIGSSFPSSTNIEDALDRIKTSVRSKQRK